MTTKLIDIKQFGLSQYDVVNGSMACTAISMVAGIHYLRYGHGQSIRVGMRAMSASPCHDLACGARLRPDLSRSSTDTYTALTHRVLHHNRSKGKTRRCLWTEEKASEVIHLGVRLHNAWVRHHGTGISAVCLHHPVAWRVASVGLARVLCCACAPCCLCEHASIPLTCATLHGDR